MDNDLPKVRPCLELQFAILGQRINEIAVMHDLEIRPILGVLILESVEAVGALRDDFGYASILEHLNVLTYHTIVHVLIAKTAQTIPAALFVSS
jgi:hypothetical protein